MDLSFTINTFSNLFGTSVIQLPNDTKEVISKVNFRYDKVTNFERDKIILNILRTLEDNSFSISGGHRIEQWEKGWNENLKKFSNGSQTFDELIPGYYRPNLIHRFDGDYIHSEKDDFEFQFFKVLQSYIFQQFIPQNKAIYEFGCGSGHNLPILLKYHPSSHIYGLDWSINAVKLVNEIGNKYSQSITGYYFNMFKPDYNLKIDDNSIFITIGAMEQLGHKFKEFIKFILNKKPLLSIHIEPLCELYNYDYILFDYLAYKFHIKRNYLGQVISYLKFLEKQNKVAIKQIKRMPFGGMYHEGWSWLIWQPI